MRLRRIYDVMNTLLLDIANVFLFGSGFLMLYTAYKDRDVLRGYNFTGTLLIVTAISLFLAYYAQQEFWLSFVLTVPNYVYWLMVCFAVVKKRIGY